MDERKEVRNMSSATFKQLMENAQALANDPEMKRQIEAMYNIPENGCACYVDSIGIVHICTTDVYVSNTASNHWGHQV